MDNKVGVKSGAFQRAIYMGRGFHFLGPFALSKIFDVFDQ